MISMKQFKNELLPIQLLRTGSPYLGGNSPLSIYCLYQNRAASKAWDLLAKRFVSTSESTHFSSVGSIVTPTFGLFSEILISSKIPPMVINIHDRILPLIYESRINGEPEYERTTFSGRYAPGRDGGEDADIPDRRGRTGHTHVGQSLVRVLSFGGHGRLHEDGDVGSRYCDGSETDNPVRAQGITDGSMSDSIKPFTSAECGRRFTLTAPCYPIIQILDGAFRPAELFPNVSSAGKHLSPVREHTSEKWEGGASAPPETYPEAI